MVGYGWLTQILFASVCMYVLVSCCVFVRSGLGSCFHSALVSTYLKSSLVVFPETQWDIEEV